MDKFQIDYAIKEFTLNQRRINCQFKKSTGINRTDIEVLTFASTAVCFNPYEVQKQFVHMNMQQVRLSIRKLTYKSAIELIGLGKKGSPAVYMITKKGKALLGEYNECWLESLSF